MKDKEDFKEKLDNTEEPKNLNRKEFLKVLGVGIGAVGLGLAGVPKAIGLGSPSSEPSTRALTKSFLKDLIKDPHLAAKFLDNPVAAAKMYGIQLSERDLSNIHDSLTKLAAAKSKSKGPAFFPVVSEGGAVRSPTSDKVPSNNATGRKGHRSRENNATPAAAETAMRLAWGKEATSQRNSSL